MLRVTWPRAAAWLVRRHHLDRRAPAGSLLAVAHRLCGLHAQVLSSAELTAWARVEDLDRGAVRRALWEDRSLVKTWAMRGTLHLLPADELPLWHAALGTIRRYLNESRWQKNFGITLDDLDQVTEAVAAALAGRVLTREELAHAVIQHTGSTAFGDKVRQSSWGTMLRPAAFSGRLCFGPSVGQRVRFTNPNTWLGTTPSAIDPGTATATVTRRFLSAYGPATYLDLARWWTGGGVGTARKWIAALGDEVTPVEVEGVPAWMLAADARKLRDVDIPRSVRLLPAFDQYVVASSPHADHLVPGGWRQRVYRPQGWISPVLLVNGRMLGTWRYTIKGSRVEVVVQPFVATPTWARRAGAQEAERLAKFLGGTLKLTWKR
jgi:Winged helix DNA-binding domain